MNVQVRTIAISTGIAIVIAGGVAAMALLPGVLAAEPVNYAVTTAQQLFPEPFDTSKLRKFTITTNDAVATKVQHTEIVSKISGGERSLVSIVTTASGTYSSDALTSPNIRYPGIDVTPKYRDDNDDWYFYGSSTTPRGKGTWTSFSRGSFTYYNYVFEPATHT